MGFIYINAPHKCVHPSIRPDGTRTAPDDVWACDVCGVAWILRSSYDPRESSNSRYWAKASEKEVADGRRKEEARLALLAKEQPRRVQTRD